MGLKVEMKEIPCLDFNIKDLDQQGSEGWKELCKQVREACESYGCFQVSYNKVPLHLYQDMSMALKELFDLPLETKQKNSNPKPYYGYLGKCAEVPLFESLGIEDAPKVQASQAFTQLMWPDEGNPTFCNTLHTMSKMMYELELIIWRMIIESFGVEQYYASNVESCDNIFRVMKYSPPDADSNDPSAVGLVPHTDKGVLTILYQDLNGLEILSEDDEWFPVAPLQGTFVVFVGEALKAWSNGRLVAAKHRVMMKGEKERYTYALFASPKEGAVIEVPKELVDEDHPLLYRPFVFMEFLSYFYSSLQENALEVYAGVSS